MARERGDDLRGQVARTRAAALRPRLAQLRLRIAGATLGLQGIGVTINGVALPEAGSSHPTIVDPGLVSVEVTAPGHQRWEGRVTARGGASATVLDVPELSPLGRTGVSAPIDSGAPGAASEPSGGFTLAALVLGGLGIVSLGAGVYFGSQAVDLANESKETVHCPLTDVCRGSGVRLREQAREAAHRADLGVGVGATLLLSAVVLYLIAPSGSEEHAESAWSLDVEEGVALGWRRSF